jgi:hypothetical protein
MQRQGSKQSGGCNVSMIIRSILVVNFKPHIRSQSVVLEIWFLSRILENSWSCCCMGDMLMTYWINKCTESVLWQRLIVKTFQLKCNPCLEMQYTFYWNRTKMYMRCTLQCLCTRLIECEQYYNGRHYCVVLFTFWVRLFSLSISPLLACS